MGALIMGASSAEAVSASGTAWTNTTVISGETAYRANAYATSLNDAKFRAKLVRNWGPDYSSSWTTLTYVTVRTGYYTCWQGCYAIYEYRQR